VKKVESENVQTKNSKVEKNVEQIMKFFWKNYIFKEKSRENIIKMFYVRHFIVWRMGKRLKEQFIKSWNVFCLMLIL
jgi:hypothetical protein